MAQSAALPTDFYWCDPDGERYTMWIIDEQTVQAYATRDVHMICKIGSDDLTLQYCAYGPYSAGRKQRMDSVFVSSLWFDAEGRLSRIETTPGARTRTCVP